MQPTEIPGPSPSSAPPTGPALLDPKAAAARACVSVSLIYRWCAEGTLPHLRVGARGRRGKILVAAADLDALLASCRVGGGLHAVPAASASVRASSESLSSPFSELNPRRLARAWKRN